MSLIPLNDRVILKVADRVEKIGSLYVPETAGETPQIGTVVRGPVNRDLVPGETVVLPKFAGHKVTYKGQDVLIVEYKDLLAVGSE